MPNFRFVKALSNCIVAIIAITFCCSLNVWAQSLKKTTAYFERNGVRIGGELELEIADNDSLRSLGLMYRRSVPSHTGMLFVFSGDEQRQFWMKNTFVSLDMIFLNKNLEIQGVLEGVAPLSTEPRGLEGVKSRAVLELVSGDFKAIGLAKGDVLRCKEATLCGR